METLNHSVSDWLVMGSGAIVRECFLPAFEYLNLLKNLTVVDLVIPDDLRKTYPEVEFIAGSFRDFPERRAKRVPKAAVIALPNEWHEEAAVRLLGCGLHVLCEKPLALTEAACFRLQRAAKDAGRLLSVSMIRRFFPSVRIALQTVREGKIGKLTSISVEHGGTFVWPARSLAPFLPVNGGVFADMGVHYLDLVERFVGPVRLAGYRDDWQGGVEAEAVAELRSACDVSAHIGVSRVRQLSNTITLTGTDGSIVFSVDSLSSITLRGRANSDSLELRPLEPFQFSSLPPSFPGCFVEQLRHFSARAERGCVSDEDAVAAARSARIIEQAYRERIPAVRVRTWAATSLEPAATMITGATGFIGTRLVERLFDCGFSEVTGIVRRPQTCAAIGRYPIRFKSVNLLDAESVREAVRGQRYVFHLAYGRDGADAESVTVRGTQNVVNAAVEAGCEAIVVLSTINVLGWPDGEVDELAPYAPAGGEYGRTKANMEKWCLKRAEQSPRTRIVLLLPSCVYGPRGKTFTELPAYLAAAKAFGWIAEGKGMANYVFIDNLIDAMFLAAGSARAHGQRFIINDGWTNWRNFLSPIVGPWIEDIRSYQLGDLKAVNSRIRAGAFARAIRTVTANADFRREIKNTWAGQFIGTLVARTGINFMNGAASAKSVSLTGPPSAGEAGSTPLWIEDLFGIHQTRFSSAKARAVLDWTPSIPLVEGQQLAVDYLRAAGLHPVVTEDVV